MSSTLPTGVRALLGLAAMALEEVRKFPETLPTVAATVPVGAISTAMQASLKFQQQVAVLASRGDEVISQFRGSHEDPPAWATFDDDEPTDTDTDTDPADAKAAETRPLAAFERVDYAAPAADPAEDLAADLLFAPVKPKKSAAVKAAARKAPGKNAAPGLSPAEPALAKPAPPKPAPPKPGPPKPGPPKPGQSKKAPAKKAAKKVPPVVLTGGPAATSPAFAAGPATPPPSSGPAVPNSAAGPSAPSGPLSAGADEE